MRLIEPLADLENDQNGHCTEKAFFWDFLKIQNLKILKSYYKVLTLVPLAIYCYIFKHYNNPLLTPKGFFDNTFTGKTRNFLRAPVKIVSFSVYGGR